MKVTKISNYGGRIESTEKIDAFARDINRDLLNIVLCLSGRIRFGDVSDGNRGENVAGEWQVVTTNATPDTEDAFSHGLGTVPQGYIVVKRDKAGVIYDGSTSWTSSNIYLRSDVASVTATIFLIK